MSLHKSYEVTSFKALPTKDGEPKKFEAIVSAFGNVDLVGDRVVKGAFEANLKELREAGDPIPVIWSHEWGNPNAHIGWADPKETVEVDAGLKVIGYIDDKPFANQVYDLLKDRRVKEFSFAYDVVREKRAKDGANELLELRILEVGPTLKGANPATQLLGVKSALEAAHAKEIVAEMPGSDEERKRALLREVREWAKENLHEAFANIVATYADEVVVSVHYFDGSEPTYQKFSHDGKQLTGDPEPVEVSVSIASRASDDPKHAGTAVVNVVGDFKSLADQLEEAAGVLRGIGKNERSNMHEAGAKNDRDAEDAKPDESQTKGDEPTEDAWLLSAKAQIEELSS